MGLSLRHVDFNENREAWVTIYPIQGNGSPYFDFAYLDDASPQERLAEVLASFAECEVIDWSPGRLACIQADGADVTRLATIITAVAKAAFGIDRFNIDAFYEDFQQPRVQPPTERPNPSIKGAYLRQAPYVER